VQLTPHNSEASIILGNTIPPARAQLLLAVNDIDAARNDLLARGVDVSEVFHFAAGPFNTTVPNPRVAGRDPENRPYFTFVSFEDPDGNSWFVQEIKMRLPGREWQNTAQAGDVAALAALLRETAEHHDVFEKTHGEHQWWDWYAPYLNARQNGSNTQEAAAAADRHMEKLLGPAR
jgi:hypothetical protein